MAKNTPIDSLLEQLIDRLADRLASQLGGKVKPGKAGRVGARRGKKLDMSCRVAGCKNRSRGPRFGFICDDHRRKLSKGDQAAAREAWKAKKK